MIINSTLKKFGICFLIFNYCMINSSFCMDYGAFLFLVRFGSVDEIQTALRSLPGRLLAAPVGEDRTTALHLSVRRATDSDTVTEMLIQSILGGSDRHHLRDAVRTPDSHGLTALQWATMTQTNYPNPLVIQNLIDMLLAAVQGDEADHIGLISFITWAEKSGRSALYWTVFHKSLEATSILLSALPSRDTQRRLIRQGGHRWETAHQLAHQNGSPAIAGLFDRILLADSETAPLVRYRSIAASPETGLAS